MDDHTGNFTGRSWSGTDAAANTAVPENLQGHHIQSRSLLGDDAEDNLISYVRNAIGTFTASGSYSGLTDEISSS